MPSFLMGSSIATTESLPSSSNFEGSNSVRGYDVFLNFRGEDTRSNFTSHLDKALQQHQVNVFIDDKLNRGEEISKSIFRSIEESFISIVIFSENYAYSSWCLDELVKILECNKSNGQIVLPIFYKVDPSNIRKQAGNFGKGLITHDAEYKKKIQNWRKALTTAANLAGYVLGTKKEADLIQEVVVKVLSTLSQKRTYSNGIEFSQENRRLHSQSRTQHESSVGFNAVGIHEIGSIVKMARALYNKVTHLGKGQSNPTVSINYTQTYTIRS